MARKPRPTIGVSDYCIYPITGTDDSGMPIFGAPARLPGTVEIAPTDRGGSDAFDADNGAYEVETYLENMGHDITNADIPPSVDAMMRGLELKHGVLDVGAVTTAPEFGVAWRLLKSDGSHRYVMYYRGKYSFASNVGGKTKPSSGAAEKQTAQANYTALQTDNGKYYKYRDDAELTAAERQLVEEEFLGTAFPVGFSDVVVVNGRMLEKMGTYTFTGEDTIRASFAAASGIVTVSFDMLMFIETGRVSDFYIRNTKGEKIIEYKLCEYGSSGDLYLAKAGDSSVSTLDAVKAGTYCEKEHAYWTHFVCTLDMNSGTAALAVSNDANSTKGLFSGKFSAQNPLDMLTIHSNHRVNGRMNSVKNLAVSIVPGEAAALNNDTVAIAEEPEEAAETASIPTADTETIDTETIDMEENVDEDNTDI